MFLGAASSLLEAPAREPMKLRTLLRDCLYLSWALPVEALPKPPAPLRYEVHLAEEGPVVFATAVLVRQRGMRLSALPVVRLSYPQMNLRLCVLDPAGMPSVLFRRILVPAWVLPGVRAVTGQPVRRARFRFPDASRGPQEDSWRWEVVRGARFRVVARPGSPRLGPGPRLGSWDTMVKVLRERPVGFVEKAGGLRRIETAHPPVAVWPMVAEVEEEGLLERSLPLAGGRGWPPLYSAFLCPEVPMDFELVVAPEVPVVRRVPAPG